MKSIFKNLLFVGIWFGITVIFLIITFQIIKSIYFLAIVSEILPIIIVALLVNRFNDNKLMNWFFIVAFFLWNVYGSYSWQSYHIYFRSSLVFLFGVFLWFLFRNKLKISNSFFKIISIIIIGLILYFLEPKWEQKLFDYQALKKINNQKFEFNFIPLDSSKKAITKFETNNVYVLNLWTNTCGICVEEFPIIAKFKNKYKNNLNIHFISLNTNDSADAVRKFTPIQLYNFDVYLDSGKSIFYQLKLRGVPATLIINKKGEIEKMMSGFNKTEQSYFENNINEGIENALK